MRNSLRDLTPKVMLVFDLIVLPLHSLILFVVLSHVLL